MKLYHGTNTDIQTIDFNKCNPNKDFGQGFYLTDIKEQAVLMAKRRVRITNIGTPVVLEYDFDINSLSDGQLQVKIFDRPSKEWALFILANRKSSSTGFKHNYDIVIGLIADDGVVFQLERYEHNLITLDTLVREVTFRELNKQYFFGTNKAVATLTRI
ncbi:MAG: DUF3990 domain-containing protein [Bacteroidales bacterium]|nr:DUF3990 domain-containing protein [Bacteroidales bacterium]